ncbi:Uma2 family endonuclease [Geminocystis sp. CENA526]|uniref:Uma2 family endonuclease n=1 Tax=Geminocystis sp. CENA526 TaxID=1355871 RepID=UPI003D6F6CD2
MTMNYQEELPSDNNDLVENNIDTLTSIEKQLFSLESASLSEQMIIIRQIFYSVYLLKDNVNLLPYEDLTIILYSLENILVNIQTYQVNCEQKLISLLVKVFDAISFYIRGINNQLDRTENLSKYSKIAEENLSQIIKYLDNKIQEYKRKKVDLLTFADYLQQYPQKEGIFEFIDGELVEIKQVLLHKNISRFLMFTFHDEIKRLKLPYIVDKDVIIRTINKKGKERARIPHVSVVKESIWIDNMTKYDVIIQPLELVVEIVSHHWQDDYIQKLEEYQNLAIKEYWIVDYLGVFSVNYMDSPQVPTMLIYQLINGKYEVQSFHENELIRSNIFPQLNLTMNDIINQ